MRGTSEKERDRGKRGKKRKRGKRGGRKEKQVMGFCAFFFWPHHEACRILVFDQGLNPGLCSFNQQMAGEVPK